MANSELAPSLSGLGTRVRVRHDFRNDFVHEAPISDLSDRNSYDVDNYGAFAIGRRPAGLSRAQCIHWW